MAMDGHEFGADMCQLPSLGWAAQDGSGCDNTLHKGEMTLWSEGSQMTLVPLLRPQDGPKLRHADIYTNNGRCGVGLRAEAHYRYAASPAVHWSHLR